MSKVKTPQEKKTLSYTKDRRNSYGESDKGSRKSIRKNKRNNARSERSREQRLTTLPTEVSSEDELTEIENKVIDETKSKHLGGFKKYPDAMLQDHIEGQKIKRGIRYGRKQKNS